VVVIGGGPAGSAAATLLARAGLETVLLEKAQHPRPQVGESLIPHIWKFTDKIGVSEKIMAEGFVEKSGGIVVWDNRIRHFSFGVFGFRRPALHVERDRFDEILLRHAESEGAQVFERVVVRSAEGEGPPAPMTVLYEDRRGDRAVTGSIEAGFVVDASGQSGVMAAGASARRRVGSDGKYLGVWGYFRNSRYLAADRRTYEAADIRRVKPVTFISSFGGGWAWHIPMRNETSVGLVLNTAETRGLGRREHERFFLETCRSLPYVRELLADAEYVPDSVTFRPDYSYYSERITGPGFVCAGDAASFVDPIFSQGVSFALYTGCLAAWVAQSALANPGRAGFYQDVFRNRSLELYGFARLLAFGDFGGDGVDPEAVRRLVLGMPRGELELSLTVSSLMERPANLHRMLVEAGHAPQWIEESLEDRSESLISLRPPADTAAAR
jgi:flavin-dependent dehydrogenase